MRFDAAPCPPAPTGAARRRAQAKTSAIALGLALALAGTACDSRPKGAVTARLVLDDGRGQATRALRADDDAIGRRRSGLSPRAVPDEVKRLEIYAVDTTGSTVATALLDELPSGNEQQLVRAGGTWRMDEVPVGTGYTLRARAILGSAAGTALIDRIGFAGELRGVEVRSGETTDAGTLTLTLLPGIRLPRLDELAPAPPSPLVVVAPAAGEALDVSWTRPPDADVAGYVVALGAATSTAPALMRRLPPKSEGELLAPGVRVAAWIPEPSVTTVTVPGLVDGQAVRVFVYAYDGDAGNGTLGIRALNFSPAAVTIATPRDTAPPDAVPMLAIRAIDTRDALVAFTGTGDDGLVGAPARYELRASRTRADLETPAGFEQRPAIAGVPVVPTMTVGMFQTSFASLGFSASTPFFIGLRAVDAASNAGPIVVAQYTVSATAAPNITRLEPEIALAGQTLEIVGELFGVDTGTVTLVTTTGTTTRTRTLAVSAWSDESVRVSVPADAQSGTLALLRPGRPATVASVPLAVLQRAPLGLGASALPFAVATARLPGRALLHALLRVIPGASNGFAVERIIGGVPEGVRHGAFSAPAQPYVASAAYSSILDRFAFATANSSGPARVSLTLVSSSTVAPAPFNRSPLANVANVDGIAALPLADTGTTPPAGVPLFLALSSGGLVRTASVHDVLTTGVSRFHVLTPTTSWAERAQVLETRTGTRSSYTLAYAERATRTATAARLVLSSADAIERLPAGFVERARGPEVPGRFVLLDVPGHDLFVVFEANVGARREVRIAQLLTMGFGEGWAPLADITDDWTLDDASVVDRGAAGAAISLALRRSTGAAMSQLYYVEVEPSRVRPSGRGTHRGVALDMAFGPAEARLGCRPATGASCPIVVAGPMAGSSLYFRR